MRAIRRHIGQALPTDTNLLAVAEAVPSVGTLETRGWLRSRTLSSGIGLNADLRTALAHIELHKN